MVIGDLHSPSNQPIGENSIRGRILGQLSQAQTGAQGEDLEGNKDTKNAKGQSDQHDDPKKFHPGIQIRPCFRT